MYEIYEGDFLLFTTNDTEEADYYKIEGYIVRKVQCEYSRSGSLTLTSPAILLQQVPLKKVPVFLTSFNNKYILLR